MTWGMVAVGGATLIGGAIAADGARSAANKQADAAAASNDTQKAMYDQTREDNQPALQARNASLSRLQDLLGISGNKGASGYGSFASPIDVGNVQNEAGYQFGLQQGQAGLNRQLAARGMLNSGAALKAASRYATDYASTRYNDAYNRRASDQTRQLNALQSTAGLGQSGASTIGSAGANAANNISNTQASLGNALAASSLAQSNAWSDGVNQLGGWYAYYNRPKG